LIRRTLTEFFRDLLREAMQTRKVTSSEDSEHYLVQLLERFAHPAQGWDSRPLALEYLEALRPPAHCAKVSCRRYLLFMTGIFMESLERQIVQQLLHGPGSLAYRQLAERSRRQRLAATFVELSKVRISYAC
jgi:hypothetical protein